MEVDIEGYYCISKQYPDLKSIYLPKDVFKQSIRRFELSNLKITTIEKYVGSFPKITTVIGVVDVKGSLIPFFIEEQKVSKLKKLMGTCISI